MELRIRSLILALSLCATVLAQDLAYIKTSNTPGKVEVHILSAASNYQTWTVHAATALSSDDKYGTFQLLPNGDLAYIKTSNTPGKIEVHILSAASNYQTWTVHAATAISSDDKNGTFQLLPNRDFAYIKTSNTPGKIEVHVLSASSNYQSWIMHAATAIDSKDIYGTFQLFNDNPTGPAPKPSPDLIIDEGGTELPNRYDIRAISSIAPQNQSDPWAVLQSGFISLGTCWAFAAVSAIEYSYRLRYNVGPKLSEQDVINCSGAGGTSGGNSPDAFKWMKDGGRINYAKDRPYTGAQGTCGGGGEFGITDYGSVDTISVPGSSEHTLALKKAIIEHGALVVSVCADGWSSYTSGVFNGTATGETNHAVCIIGWDDTKQAWIIRNSWGGWGETCGWGSADGYAYVKYGSQKIGSYAHWVEALKPRDVGYVRAFCEAGYVCRFRVLHKDPDGTQKQRSVKLTAGFGAQFRLDGKATEITIIGEQSYLIGWKQIFQVGPFSSPPNKCYKAYGTIFEPQWNENCDMEFNSGNIPQVDVTGYVKVFCEAGYVTEFQISYTAGGQRHSASEKLTAGFTKTWTLPDDATAIHVRGIGIGAGSWFSDETIFDQHFAYPPNACFKTYGTIGDVEWSTNCD